MSNITYKDLEFKISQKVLVDNQGGRTLVPFIRTYVYDDCGELDSVNDTDFDGNTYAVVGTVEENSKKIDFVDSLKEDDRLKVDITGSLDSTNACVYLYQSIQQTNINNTGVVLNLDVNNINTNPGVIDVTTNPGEYIFIISGHYELELQITADTQDNARRTSRTTLQVFNGTNWVEAIGANSCYGYHRNNASGENTAYNRVIVTAQSNERYRFVTRCLNNGLIRTVPDGTSLVIKKI